MKEIGNSFSTGNVVPQHNFRTGRIPNNVDKERIKDNVILIDNLHGRTIEQFTNDELQPYIDRYNEKQKQKCRRIETNYTEWHLQNGLLTKNAKTKEDVKFAFEAVLCYGSHEDLWNEYFDENTNNERKKEMYNEAVDFYKNAVEEFQRKYPHLKIIYAVIHADEPNGSIHCHLCFQARAEYTRGLGNQVCLGRALAQDGFERCEKRSDAEKEGFQLSRMYKDFRHNVLNRQAIELGYEIKEEQHGIKHIDSTAFGQKMDEAKQIVQEARAKAEILDRFAKQEQEMDRLERVPEYNPKDVKRVQVKETPFSKPVEVVQMSVDTFDSLRVHSDVQKVVKDTREKIKKQNELYNTYIDNLTTPQDQLLKEENERLKDELKCKEFEIRSKDIQIRKLSQQIENLRYSIKRVFEVVKNANFNLFNQIKDMLTRNERELGREF